MFATREDVIKCYDVILGRRADNEAVIAAHLADAPSIWQLVERFCSSLEFRKKTSALTLTKCDHDYLLKSLDVKARRACFLHHHTFVANTLKPQVVEHLHEGGRHSLFLIAPSLKVQDVSVYLQCPHQYFSEGELELILEYQGVRIYTMSFSFVPEQLFGTCEGSTILITRMQGELGRKSEIKQLAAGTLGTSPQLILYSILVGVATRCGIRAIIGASAANQICNTFDNHDGMTKAYDLFYRSLGAEPSDRGIFRMDLSRLHKSAAEVTGTKRRRLRLRRELRDNLSQTSASSWVQIALRN